MDIKQLRHFLAIVEEGSFSRAALRIGVAQPALSLRVRKMEEALGTPLLLRSAGGVTPTEAGELLARRARTLLADLDRTEEEIRSLGAEPSGKVRIGLPGTISGIVSVPLIALMRARHPRIRLNIAEAMSGFVAEWLRDGRIDLAVLYTDMPEAGIAARPLLAEELVVLTPPGANGPEIESLSALADMALVLPSAAHGLRAMIDRGLRAHGVSVEPAIEVDSYANIKRLVAAGYGSSILPFHAVAAEAQSGALTVRRFAHPRLWRRAHLASATARPMTRAAAAVAEALCEVSARLIADGVWAGARRLGPDQS
jgi:LysR family nitrogen assimilation transcriptional regulator